MEDPLQAQRLKYAFESEKGLLGTSECRCSVYSLFVLNAFQSECFFFLLSFDAPEQQRGQQTLLSVCEVPGHIGPEVSPTKCLEGVQFTVGTTFWERNWEPFC